MSVRKPKLVGFFDFEDVQFDAERTIPAGAGSQSVSLTAGEYFPSGEGASDSEDGVYQFKEDVKNTHANFTNFTATISSDGFVTLYSGVGETIVITWGAAGAAFRDWLGFTGPTTTVVNSGTTALNRVDLAYFAPWGVQVDEPVDRIIYSSSKAVGGQIYAVKLGKHQFVDFEITFKGHWRNPVDGHYSGLRRLWREHLLPRKRARYYLDASATGAFDEDTNRYGYLVVQLADGENEWNVRPVNRQNRVRYEGAWRFALYAA